MITDVQLVLQECEPPLLAYVNFIIDYDFLVHGARLIEANGRQFVSMPNAPRNFKCPGCRSKVQQGSRFCPQCGVPTPPTVLNHKEQYRDVIHPITPKARDMLTERVVLEYKRLLALRAKQHEQKVG